jgi:predicted TIM-barrel fold metal-dependent hydrolase
MGHLSSFTNTCHREIVSSTTAAIGSNATIVKAVPQSTFHRMPDRSWDSHMHVIGDQAQYPISKTAVYTPSPQSVYHAWSFEFQMGISIMVLVQPSIYEDDNSCLLDALQVLGPKRGRGVVVFDIEKIDSAELSRWNAMGVRGVRVNLKSGERNLSDDEFKKTLQRYADAVRPFNWVLQLYIPMAKLPLIETIAESLNITICLDHFACPTLDTQRDSSDVADPSLLEGWSSLVRLVTAGRTYVKISAPYRLTKESGDVAMLEAMFTELSRNTIGRHRLVWASDWPHTRFEGLQIAPFTNLVMNWCGEHDHELKELLFRDNAAELWR